jgi:starvation-inducible DNA-binding protein
MINIDLSAQSRAAMVKQLELLLANEYVLYTKTLKFHWNIEGKHFGALHALFQKQYEQLLTIVDDVAERMRALGHFSTGTLTEFLKQTTLSESPGDNPKDLKMIELLVQDHEAIIRQVRKDADLATELKDTGTNNFLAQLLETHEKMAWFLRAHVQGN